MKTDLSEPTKLPIDIFSDDSAFDLHAAKLNWSEQDISAGGVSLGTHITDVNQAVLPLEIQKCLTQSQQPYNPLPVDNESNNSSAENTLRANDAEKFASKATIKKWAKGYFEG